MVTGSNTPYIFPQAALLSTRAAQVDGDVVANTDVGPPPGDVVEAIAPAPAPAPALRSMVGPAPAPAPIPAATAMVNPPINDGQDMQTAQAWEQYAMKQLSSMGAGRQFNQKDLRHINGVIHDTAEALKQVLEQTTNPQVQSYVNQTLQNLTQAAQIYGQIPDGQAVTAMASQLYQHQTNLDQQNQNINAQMNNSRRVGMAVAEVPMNNMQMPMMGGMAGMGGMPGMGMTGMPGGMPINVPPMPPGVATPYGVSGYGYSPMGGMGMGMGMYPPGGYPPPGYPAPGMGAPGYGAAGYPGAPGYAGAGYPGTGYPGTQYPMYP
ncbi:MAG TPA: hypothetical protein VGO93_06325 [Candidatus Xenobia bacterium]|jgi:hypothetical protein